MLTPETLIAMYPKYSKVAPLAIQRAIDKGARECPELVWGDDRDEGIFLYTQHLLELEWGQMAQMAGATTAIARGQSGNAFLTGTHLEKTVYGQEFTQLRDRLTSTTGFVI